MAFGTTITPSSFIGTHTGFVALIDENDLPSAMLNGADAVDNGGGNLRAYTDSTKATQLPLDVVTFVTGATPSVEVWVRYSGGFASSSTIYLEADDVATAQPATTALYGRNNVWQDYETVTHDGITDATGNYTFTANGGVTQGGATGIIGADATDFDGADDYIDVATWNPSLEHTITAWVNTGSVQQDNGVTGGASGTFQFWLDTIGAISTLRLAVFGGTSALYGGTTIDADTDYFVATTNNGSVHNLFLNGANDTSGSTIPTTSLTSDTLSFGRASVKRFDGIIDEWRVRNSASSGDWLATEFANQSTTSWFSNDGWNTTGGGVTIPIFMQHYKRMKTR